MDKITLSLEAELTRSPDKLVGSAFLKISDTTAHAKIGDKDLGFIAGVIGGGVELMDVELRSHWYISVEEFWGAFQGAIAKYKLGNDLTGEVSEKETDRVGWIKCSDRLPDQKKDGERVIGYDAFYSRVGEAMLADWGGKGSSCFY